MEFEFNSYSKYGRKMPSGMYYIAVPMKPSKQWQTVEVDVSDIKVFQRTQNGRPADWQTLDHLSIIDRITVDVDGDGKKETIKSNPVHGRGRQMRNVQWVGGEYPKVILMNGGGLELSPEEYQNQFSSQIDVSLELENDVDGIQKAQH